MQEHFNENYMESDQYPKATFKGEIQNPNAVNFQQDGEYPARVRGELTIHGVTQPLETGVTFVVQNDQISGRAEFEVSVADYNIEIPRIVREKIAKTVLVEAELEYEPLSH